jgi:hypothetical protein
MLNLHDIVRGVITTVHDDESVIYYQSTGQKNVDGELVPSYADPVTVRAQNQPDNAEDLRHVMRESTTEISRVFYLYSDSASTSKPAGILRPFARTGDMFQREVDGTWWLVTAVPEDFALAGWVKVRVTLQVNPPRGVVV